MIATQLLQRCFVSMVVVCVVLFSTVVLFAQDSASTPAGSGFAVKAMLRNITYGVILPYHQQLVEKTESLEKAVAAFVDWSSQPNLDAVQVAWKETSFAWEHCQLFIFRRVMAYHSAINKTPTNSEFIEEFIAGDDVLDEAFINSIGSTSKGLPAIEYLVFGAGGDDTAPLIRFSDAAAGKRRLAYLLALAQHLNTTAHTLYTVWSPDGENYAEMLVNADQDSGDLQGSINMLINLIVPDLDRIVQNAFVASDQAGTGDERQLNLTEGNLSGFVVPQLTANLDSIRMVFTGSTDIAPPAGLNGYLDNLGSQSVDGAPLSQALMTQFDDAIAKVGNLQPVIDGDPNVAGDTVMQAYWSIRTLLTMMRVDVASQLGVTITISDVDGD